MTECGVPVDYQDGDGIGVCPHEPGHNGLHGWRKGLRETTVAHWLDREGVIDEDWVYIGRSIGDGYFGNPFIHGRDGTRSAVIAKFEEYFLNRVATDPEFLRRVLALQGKQLVCHCKPQACHGDFIAAWLDDRADDAAIINARGGFLTEWWS